MIINFITIIIFFIIIIILLLLLLLLLLILLLEMANEQFKGLNSVVDRLGHAP